MARVYFGLEVQFLGIPASKTSFGLNILFLDGLASARPSLRFRERVRTCCDDEPP